MKDFVRGVFWCGLILSCGFAFAAGAVLLAKFFLSLIAMWFVKLGFDIPLVFIW